MLACECLNVIVETETAAERRRVSPADLQLEEVERADPFFQQEIEQVGKLIKINKVHSGLIQTRIVGRWIVHRCLNCGVNSHAVHQQRGAAFVLVASRLLKKDMIDALQRSDAYSDIYNIAINPHEFEEKHIEEIPQELQGIVSNLKQIASDILAREAAAAEERIRLFTEQQTIALDTLRERALREHKSLIKKLVNGNATKTSRSLSSERSPLNSPKPKAQKLPDNLTSGGGAATSHPISIKPRQNQGQGAVRGRKVTPKRKAERRLRQTASTDAEGMFQFDATDEEESTFQSEFDESDTDDTREDAIGASKDRSPINIAKSLPMDIPVFMSSLQNHVQDDLDDPLLGTEDALDIAASIKALARSVHGDTVFGDLPRPKFSTQI